MKHTPLIEQHRVDGAKLVDFAGWEMPIQYASVIDEYQAVRSAAGLFDVSHMGAHYRLWPKESGLSSADDHEQRFGPGARTGSLLDGV